MLRFTTPLLAAVSLVVAVAGASATGSTPAPGTIVFASNRGENVTPRLYAVRASGGRRRSLARRALQPTAVSVSHGGHFVAFVDAPPPGDVRGAYVVSVGGGGLHRIAGGRYDRQIFQPPAWSRDDQLLALSVTDRGRTRIVVVRRDGTHWRTIAADGADPAWSPDNRTIAYGWQNRVTAVTLSGRRVWSVPGFLPKWAPAGGLVEVQRGLAPSGGPATTIAILDARGKLVRQLSGHDPSWAPDGRRIAFARGARIYTATLPRGAPVAVGRGRGAQGTAWAPSGGRIAFADEKGQIAVVAAGGGRQVAVGRGILASWSRDGSRLAFLYRQLYVVRPTGRALRRLTNEPIGSELTFAWAGTQLVYTSSHLANDYELYRMPGRGGEGAALTHDRITERSPAISPEGTRIAFSRDDGISDVCIRPGCSVSIWTMTATGQELRKVTRPPADDVYFDAGASWAPDGRTLVFQRGSARGSQLMVVGVDGANLRPLMDASEDYPAQPSWGPDGRIAFALHGRGARLGIFTINPDGSGLSRLVVPPISGDTQDAYSPTWAPDGGRLAFIGVKGIYIVSSRGEPLAQIRVPGLFDASESAVKLSWSPDGKRIAYDLNDHIYSVGLDGSKPRRLTEGISPDWG